MSVSSRGYLYYILFEDIQVFKVGRTIQGLRRFNNADYKRFYNRYNNGSRYHWLHMVEIENLNIVESEIHKMYKDYCAKR